MNKTARRSQAGWWCLIAALTLTIAIYWPGLSGSWLFDDYPNIVDNHAVQPAHADLASIVNAALSSPSSDFKRPLASLSFALNYLVSGLDPYGMKLTNLALHLLNGLLVFLLARALLLVARAKNITTEVAPIDAGADIIAALIAAGWMLLPINLTAVLYVVQRMESMANAFVLLGLIGYVAGRRRMLEAGADRVDTAPLRFARRGGLDWCGVSSSSRGFILCVISSTLPAAVGILAKETAVMLPLYAWLIEWVLFRFQSPAPASSSAASVTPHPTTALPGNQPPSVGRRDRRIMALFLLVLALPMLIGLAWLVPGLLKPEHWATRDFTLGTRLLSEARIVVDYIAWTLAPTPNALSFYHDNFRISTGLLAPWTTLAGIVLLATLIALTLWLRPRLPLVALGLALFLGCQLLTGTILPLELIYEHRNYFASFGLLLAIVPLLAAPTSASGATSLWTGALPFAVPRYVLLAGLMLCWMVLTALTAYAWGNPLRLAEDLAARAPDSPRAEYELGRTYIIYSQYDPSSPFTRMAYAPLERAAALPDGSILPEQALIFMNARMHLPLKDAWWTSLIGKLKAHKPGVQDESSLAALTQCDREHHCELPVKRMTEAYFAALSHPDPSARLLAMYGDYAWNVLDDHKLGLRMTEDAVGASPNEPAYQITLIRMLVVQGRKVEAVKALQKLGSLNIGGRLNTSLSELRALLGNQ